VEGDLILLKLFLALLTGASVAAPASASEGVVERSFTVIRNGEEIGTRDARIVHNGNSVDVLNVTRIQVKVLFITVYRRQENLSELWIDDQLHRFSSQIDNNGDSYSLNVVRTENGKLHVDRPAGAYEAPKNALPATFWHERVVRTNALIHVMRGRLQQVKSTFVGTEPIKIGESTIEARRYRMTGDERVDLWFDGKGLAVKVTYYNRNGGTIDFLAKDNIGAAGQDPPKP
jgi:hypothetical protein